MENRIYCEKCNGLMSKGGYVYHYIDEEKVEFQRWLCNCGAIIGQEITK